MSLKRKWIASPNYSSRGGAGVRLVVVHTAEGSTNAADLGAFFANPASQVSSHTGIDDTAGTIWEYVKPGNKAWTAADHNPHAIQTELCAFAAWSPADWDRHPAMLENCGRWIREECDRYGLPVTKLSAGQAQGAGRGVCGHVDLGAGGGGHWDPGPDFPWSRVLAIARGESPPTETAPKPPPPVAWAPILLTATLGEPMPPEYVLYVDNADAEGGKGYYAAYANGLVRRLGVDERKHVFAEYSLRTVTVTEEDPGTRLYRMDQTLRGYVDEGAR